MSTLSPAYFKRMGSSLRAGAFLRSARRYAALGLLLLPGLLLAQTSSPIRVMKETAIPYTRFLSKADFDLRFPGTRLSDASKLKPGWYVVYQHESLNYYFGPMLLESTGSDYLAQFEAILASAIAERPSIQDYRLELAYLPSVEPAQAPSQSPEAESGSGSQPPQEKKSLWGYIKRIFGFGR